MQSKCRIFFSDSIQSECFAWNALNWRRELIEIDRKKFDELNCIQMNVKNKNSDKLILNPKLFTTQLAAALKLYVSSICQYLRLD